ncbi:MAG: ABC transporter permease [Oscillospiraceae bacterium]|jgi:peptide/nickel transport system permease protein|nr:ABC transporter permease [Oscillospiraceae bacterium]
MRKYIIRRIFISIIILFFVALLIYCIMRLMPTSYVENLARKRAETPGSTRTYKDWLDQLNAVYGLNENVATGFFRWLGNAVRGNFGESWLFGISVTKKFSQVILDSVYLIFTATILEYCIAIPLGMLAARKQYSKTDYAVTVFALLGISLPSFFLATMMKLVFSVKLGWFDLYGKVGRNFLSLSPFMQALDIAHHYIMPILTLTLISVGWLMRYTRTNMLEVLNSDYIRTARAKGLPESRVVSHHAFRNTLIPIVTMLGGLLPGLFSGAMITEMLFQIPGIGYTSYQAIMAGDIPFAMFYMVFLAFMTLIGTLLSDILYAAVDPRIRIAG